MKLYGWLGFLLLLISEYCLFRKIEPFYSWFYSFAWWSYILLADNLLLRLRGRSLLCGRRAELWRMLPLSVFIWLIFEGYNLALRNWAYDAVPAEMWIRWVGYFLAFATVLPGVFITADIFEFILFGPQAQLASQAEEQPAPPATAPLPLLVPLGLCLSAAPLLWPRYFFPAIWVGPIFLFDPFLERLGLQSLSLRIAAGDRRKVFSLLAGGLFCGVLWEFWNFWAASRWIYSVPFFGNWKIFEMPLLGFFGFPPFALECWILYHLLTQMQRRWRSRPARAAFWLGIGLFCILMFHAIDTHTVLHFVSNGPSGAKPQSAGNAFLARISHQVSTAAADPGMSTALRSVGLLDVLSSTPAEPSGRAPCIHARLRRLATKPGEKCGLAAVVRATDHVPPRLKTLSTHAGSITA